MIRVILVDDNQVCLTSRSYELGYGGKVTIVFTARNGDEFLDRMKQLKDDQLPHIVLMDLDMPGKNGIDTVRIGKTLYPESEFIILTVFDESEKIFEAIKAGASGYILKDETSETILKHLEQVVEFRTVPMSSSVARKALKLMTHPEKPTSAATAHRLTAREIEVLRALVDGLDYREIGARLAVSPNTIRNQISSIYRKLHVTCKVDAVKVALNSDLI